LVPGNLRHLDTVGHHIEPRYFCILFPVHDTRDLHRHHDRNYRLAKLSKKEAGSTKPLDHGSRVILQPNRSLPVPSSCDFHLL
jgi:hypothetical protein